MYSQFFSLSLVLVFLKKYHNTAQTSRQSLKKSNCFRGRLVTRSGSKSAILAKLLIRAAVIISDALDPGMFHEYHICCH
jgi:hypothetical protein